MVLEKRHGYFNPHWRQQTACDHESRVGEPSPAQDGRFDPCSTQDSILVAEDDRKKRGRPKKFVSSNE